MVRKQERKKRNGSRSESSSGDSPLTASEALGFESRSLRLTRFYFLPNEEEAAHTENIKRDIY